MEMGIVPAKNTGSAAQHAIFANATVAPVRKIVPAYASEALSRFSDVCSGVSDVFLINSHVSFSFHAVVMALALIPRTNLFIDTSLDFFLVLRPGDRLRGSPTSNFVRNAKTIISKPI